MYWTQFIILFQVCFLDTERNNYIIKTNLCIKFSAIQKLFRTKMKYNTRKKKPLINGICAVLRLRMMCLKRTIILQIFSRVIYHVIQVNVEHWNSNALLMKKSIIFFLRKAGGTWLPEGSGTSTCFIMLHTISYYVAYSQWNILSKINTPSRDERMSNINPWFVFLAFFYTDGL